MSPEPILAVDHLADLGRALGPALGSVKWISLSVSSAWILQGTALIRACRKSTAVRVVALVCYSVKANLLAQSMDEEVEPAFGGLHFCDVDV